MKRLLSLIVAALVAIGTVLSVSSLQAEQPALRFDNATSGNLSALRAGNATLSGGVAVINATWAGNNTLVLVSPRVVQGNTTLGVVVNAGANITVTSSNGTDNRVINWLSLEKN